MSFPRYPKYKDSSVDWIAQVPKHWAITRLKFVTRFVNGMSFPPDAWSEDGVPIIRIENLNGGEFFNCYNGNVPPAYHVRKGDLLFGWSGNRGTSFGPFIWWRDGLHYLNQHIFRLEKFGCNKRWLYWALLAVTNVIEDEAHGIIGMVHVTRGKLGSIQVPLAPPDEQKSIAQFLDHETSKIDALIEEQQRLIDLLQEKRQAVISHAVTKGLDPNVPMKDSGVEWLGEVPAHWPVSQLRYKAVLESGHTPSRSRPEYWMNCTIPWFTLSDVWQMRKESRRFVYETKEMVSEEGLRHSSARLLPAGSVILSRTASVGFPAILGRPMAVSQDFAVWICKEELNNEYLWFALHAMRREFRRLMMGSTHQTIYMPDIKYLKAAIPPLSEQAGIVEHLNSALKEYDELQNEARRTIGLLTERRSALISAAVTGKIDARNWKRITAEDARDLRMVADDRISYG